jgi:NAD(P)-dependent dehydrogenase (short-subunit alcohol dehydrogenase family)
VKKNAVMVITGASAGIGAALAEQAAALGARVVLAARRERELGEVKSRCGPDALAVVADLTVRADAERLCAAALAKFERIDVWVNNVGRGISRPVSQLTDEDVDLMMSLNLKSALHGMQAVLPHFKARNDGQLINVSSMLGRVPFVTVRAAYSASKHALNALTASLRMELCESHPGICVSTVSPGVVATDFGLNAVHGGADSRTLPFSQTAEEVARVILDTATTRRADVYTREQFQQQVVDYYASPDLLAAERKLMARR